MEPYITTKYDAILKTFIVTSNVRIFDGVSDAEITFLRESVDELQTICEDNREAYLALKRKYRRLKRGTRTIGPVVCTCLNLFNIWIASDEDNDGSDRQRRRTSVGPHQGSPREEPPTEEDEDTQEEVDVCLIDLTDD